MAAETKTAKKLSGFRIHGVDFSHESGNQWVGDCPLCGKSGHFYANPETLLWDCKHCRAAGHLAHEWNHKAAKSDSFITRVAQRNAADLKASKEAQAQLVKLRGIPWRIMRAEGVGYDGEKFTVPIFNPHGLCVDLRHWSPRYGSRSTAGCRSGLYGAHTIQEFDKNVPVWIVEGEWDRFALLWLLSRLNEEGIVLGVPGCGTFKKEWIPLVDGREVRICYDNDKGGKEGTEKVANLVRGCAKSVRLLAWPKGTEDGYDLRDLITSLEKKPKTARRKIDSLLKDHESWFEGWSRVIKTVAGRDGKKRVVKKKAKKSKPKVRLNPERAKEARALLIEKVSRWLRMPDLDALSVMVASVLANRIPGDPLWVFLVAPPGGSKSEMLMSLGDVEETHSISSLTPATLVSGMMTKDGSDPSLLPRLDGKVLIVKDFTTVLTLHPNAREEIFGILRDAYDEKVRKVYGSGVIREYDVHFGILAGVTPVIDAYTALQHELGARFLKYRMPVLAQTDEMSIIQKAIGNVSLEDGMREDLRAAFAAYFSQDMPEALPVLDEAGALRIGRLAQLAARMRGSVYRDRTNPQLMLTRPSFEVATRLAKQLTKLAKALAIWLGEEVIGDDTFRLVAKVALDSAPDKIREVIRVLTLGGGNEVTNKELHEAAEGMTYSTVTRVLQDVEALGYAKRGGTRRNYHWSFSPDFMEIVRGSCAFDFKVTQKPSPTVKTHRTGRVGAKSVAVKRPPKREQFNKERREARKPKPRKIIVRRKKKKS